MLRKQQHALKVGDEGLEGVDTTTLSSNPLRQHSSSKNVKSNARDSGLQFLLSVWPDLPEAAKRDILSVVRHYSTTEVQS